jgi:hypothetical protein
MPNRSAGPIGWPKSTTQFKLLFEKMCQTATDVTVGMVLRFDEDDDLCWLFFSEGPSGPVESNPTYTNRGVVIRYMQKGDNPRAVSSDPNAFGFHSEELMIGCWEKILQEAATRKSASSAYAPKLVEMILTKSPCYGTKGSLELEVIRSDSKVGKYSHGCATKLKQFITGEAKSVKEWRIFFLTLAGSRTDQDSGKSTSVAHWAVITDEDLKRHKVLVQWVKTRTELTKDLNTTTENVQKLAKQKKSLESASPLDKQAVKDTGTLYGKTVKTQNKLQKELKDKELKARNDARYESMANAQRGIVELDLIGNVHVERLLGTYGS